MVASRKRRQTPVSDDTRSEVRGEVPIIRVVIGDMPEVLMRLLARAIRERSDMILVGEGHNPVEMLQIMRDDVDVVILGTETVSDCPGICSHLLSEFPHLKIVLLSHRENAARAYWLGLRQRGVAADSMQALLRGVSRVSQIDAME
jgi:DNA-binding NarL/FixJ family response regulator